MLESNETAKEFAAILRVMGHPDRIRIIDALSREEKNVKTLIHDLTLPGPRVSQHLRLLRAYRVVEERRDGRHHVYRLVETQLAHWMMRGLHVFEERIRFAADTSVQSIQ
ncbi:MAG: ArsR/SmtB family transcription factor [Gammaproteobacteria bacterium]